MIELNLSRKWKLLHPSLQHGRQGVAFIAMHGAQSFLGKAIVSGTGLTWLHEVTPLPTQLLQQAPVWSHSGTFFVVAPSDAYQHMQLVHVRGFTVEPIVAPAGPHFPLQLWPDDHSILTLSWSTGQPNLWRVYLPNGTAEQLTFHYSPVRHATISPDGCWIAYTGNVSKHLSNLDVFMLDVARAKDKLFFRSRMGARDVVKRWLDQGETLVVESDASGFVEPLLLHLRAGTAEQLSPQSHEQHLQDALSDRDHWCLLQYENGEARPAVLRPATEAGPTHGRYQRLTAPIRGTTYWAKFVGDGSSALIFSSNADQDTAVTIWNTEAGTLTDVYPSARPKLTGSSSTPTHHHITTIDGRSLPLLYHRPRRAGDKARRLGAILLHGGPADWWSHRHDPVAIAFAHAGLHLVKPNVRGSTGYGRAHQDAALGDWGGGDVLDVLAAQEFLCQRGIRPEHVLVAGHSYGGYLALMAGTLHPQAFGAIASWAGFTNLERLFETSLEIRYLLRAAMGHPAENVALWRDRSPITHANQLTLPLFLIHGVLDTTVPVEQARLLRNALSNTDRREGEAFSYIEFPDMGHNPKDIAEEVAVWQSVINAFIESLAWVERRSRVEAFMRDQEDLDLGQVSLVSSRATGHSGAKEFQR